MKRKTPRWRKSLFALFGQKHTLRGWTTTSQTMAKKTAKNNSINKLYLALLEKEIQHKKQQQQKGTNMTLKSINNTNDELELRNWCHRYFSKTGEACFTDVLLNETGNQFKGYTKPSMQAVMRKVWNEVNAPKPSIPVKNGAKKRASPVSVMTAPDLTAIARSGAQLKDDHEDIGDEEGMFIIDYLLLFVLLLIFFIYRDDDGIGHQTSSFGRFFRDDRLLQ